MVFLNMDNMAFKCEICLQYDPSSDDPFCIWLHDGGDPLSTPESISGAIAPTVEMATEMTGRHLAKIISEKLKLLE